MIVAERGIPIPPTTNGQHVAVKGPRGAKKYPVYTMAVHESFFVPFNLYRAANTCVYKHSMATGKKFIHRIVEKGVRYWRTK